MTNEKNVIILKNLSSNLVEEAIVILKDNIKSKRICKIGNENNAISENYKKGNSKEYILKEAELVISNYMKKLDEGIYNDKDKMQLKIKYKKLKFFTIGMSSVFLILIFTRLIN